MILSPRSLAVAFAACFLPAAIAAEIPKPPQMKSDERSLVLSMKNSQVRAKDPDATKAERDARVAALKKYAQYFAYTVATAPYNGEPEIIEKGKPAPGGDRTLTTLMFDFDSLTTLNGPAANNNKLTVEQIEFGEEFGAAVAEAAKVVLDNSARPIERINVVRQLALASRMPCPALADPLLNIVKNTQASDALKLYAFQGLRNLVDQTDARDPNKHVIRDVVKQGEICDAVSAYILQKRTPKDKRDQDVIEYVRREAIIVLGKFKDAVIRKTNKDLVARPAWTLMKVMSVDPNVTPKFSVQEQTEAAIGFGAMRADAEMNFDVAALFIADFIVRFTSESNEDGQRVQANGTLPRFPWKVQAARLNYSVAGFREAAKPFGATRGSAVAASLATTAQPILTPIEKDGAGAITNVNTLAEWMKANQPKAIIDGGQWPLALYRDDPKSLVPVPVVSAPTLKTPDVPPAKKPADVPMKK